MCNAPAPMLAVLTFGLHALAWGAAAVAVPVIIHLVLRQRPRREVLPTMRFLLKAHQSATRAHRLKYLILLLTRMAVILLVVGLLMKTGCAPAGAANAGLNAPAEGPVSAVLAIDDSASMQYRFQGRTRLEDAQTWARNLVGDSERFPPGSELAVLTGSTNASLPAGWSRDSGAVLRLLADVEPAWHDRPVANLVRQAYGLLSTAGHPRREVYLITDLTESGWGETLPDPPKELANVFILDVGRDENRNLALGIPETPPTKLSTNQPCAVQVKVRAGDSPTPASVTLSVDGRARDRQAVVPAPNSETGLSFTIPPLPEGPHQLLLELDPDDALSCDNRRFGCLSVGQVAGVVVVGDEGGGSVASLLAAMIAPPALPAEEHRFALQRLSGPELASARLERPLAVILADPPGLTPGGWQTLDRYVAAGGTLLLIPGPNVTPEAYAGQESLIPAEIKGVATPTEPVTLAAADMTQPYLKPFADSGQDSINDRLCYRRLELGPPRTGATIIAPFSDHAPAMLETHPGTGRVLQLAFSVDRDWGQLGTQAGPMIVLLHSILETLAPHPENIDLVLAGRLATHRWLTSAAEYTLLPPEGNRVDLPAADSVSTLPDDRPGHYRVTTGVATSQPALIYAANVAEGESELGRLKADQAKGHFRPGLAVVVHEPSELPSRRAAHGGAVSWTTPLALSLLGLLLIETLFANRFYSKKPATTPATEPEQQP